MVILLLGTGVFLTLRLGFIQLRRLGHGFKVTTGAYDDPDEPGDVSHFQALTTALSATVGIGNIAGVAIAIHWGGPGALFWMWVTAALGMATKYTEVTLAQKYRVIEETHGHAWEGTVSGGPMYYIERGLGPNWKWMAILFAVLLGLTAFLTGNAIQANTVADTMRTTFGIPAWATGVITSTVVAAVILGGITRIGKVTAILAPAMAALYVFGALLDHRAQYRGRDSRVRADLPRGLQSDRRGRRHGCRRVPRDHDVGRAARPVLQRGRAGLRPHRARRGQDRRAGVRGRGGAPRAVHRHARHLHHDRARDSDHWRLERATADADRPGWRRPDVGERGRRGRAGGYRGPRGARDRGRTARADPGRSATRVARRARRRAVHRSRT